MIEILNYNLLLYQVMQYLNNQFYYISTSDRSNGPHFNKTNSSEYRQQTQTEIDEIIDDNRKRIML